MVPYETIVEEDLNLGTGTVTLDAPAGGTMPGTQINLSTLAIQPGVSVAWNPGAIIAGAQVSTTVAVPGAVVGNMVMKSLTTYLAGLVFSAEVTAPGVVTVALYNPTGSTIGPVSGTLRVLVFAVP